MEDLVLLDMVERYLNGEMNREELERFENSRRQNADLDQLVVEQQMFMQQLSQYGDIKNFKHDMHQLHNHLVEAGEIRDTPEEERGGKLLQLWDKSRRTIAVAASIAGITALTISGTLHLLTPKATESNIQLLRRINDLDAKTRAQSQKIDALIEPAKSPETPQKSVGTSFLIDGSGYLVTNAHVVNGASTLIVVNKDKEYVARKVYNDQHSDIAILKIEDADWKNVTNLPYSIRKSAVDLGEEIFTLGYPRNEIVYNKGYMSSRSGYNDDTLSIQIAISANPGNSGGPLMDKNGDVIGILSTRDRQANEVVFASKAININRAIEQLKTDSTNLNIKIPTSSNLRGMGREQQVKKIQDCIFMVKAY